MWVFGILTLPLCEGCFGDFFFLRVFMPFVSSVQLMNMHFQLTLFHNFFCYPK